MFKTFENSPRLASATRLLLSASAAALGLGLSAPAMAQTALPPVQVTGSQAWRPAWRWVWEHRPA